MSDEPLYPEVKVKLVGEDGNAMAIMARCRQAARRAGVEKSVIDEYLEESTSGDYDKVLQTAMKYWDCDGEDWDNDDEDDY